jgi:hypothetical protein
MWRPDGPDNPMPTLRATVTRGSNFHGSDQGNADQLRNCGVLRYAQVISLIAALNFDFTPWPRRARPLLAPDHW